MARETVMGLTRASRATSSNVDFFRIIALLPRYTTRSVIPEVCGIATMARLLQERN